METFLDADLHEELVNVFPTSKGLKRIGYKTERGLIAMIKKANKNCKKVGAKMKLEIVLPIKR